MVHRNWWNWWRHVLKPETPKRNHQNETTETTEMTETAETKPTKRPKRCDRNQRNDRNKEKYIFKWPKTRFSVFSRPRAPYLGRHAMLSVISRDIPIIGPYIYSKGSFWWPFLLGGLFSEGLLSEFYFVLNTCSLFSSVTYSIGHVDLSLYISPSPHLHFLIVTWSFTVSYRTCLRPLKYIPRSPSPWTWK